MNSLKEAINAIRGVDAPGAEIFSAHRMGEISEDDWFVMEAARLLESGMDNLRPQHLPNLPESLLNYCVGRTEGALPYDREIAKRLGDWFMHVQRKSIENEDRRSMILWAVEKTEAKGLTGLVAKGLTALEQFRRASLPHGLDIALATKDKDALERVRAARS